MTVKIKLQKFFVFVEFKASVSSDKEQTYFTRCDFDILYLIYLFKGIYVNVIIYKFKTWKMEK